MVLVRDAMECFFEWLWGVLPGVAELFCYRFASKLSHGRRVIRQNLFRKSSKIGRGPNFIKCAKWLGETPARLKKYF